MNSNTEAALQLEDYGWSAHFRRAETELNQTGTIPLRVMAVHRDALDVAGPAYMGRILPLVATDEEGRATTGDWLAVEPQSQRIKAIYPRTSLFKRRRAGTTARTQLIAANVDTVLIVTSANQDFNVARVERYLAIALEAGVTPVIVITKADLADDVADYVQRAEHVRHGIFVEAVDARSPEVTRKLSPWLGRGQTIALLGSSGVGKSTIVNSLLGQPVQDTSGIREDDAHGRHTTTGRSLHRMLTGAWLMDTPGMRELQIIDAGEGIAQVFDDVAAFALACRFSDCTHQSEPGCAIRAALESGALDADRLRRYQKLLREERYNSEQIHEAHVRNKKFGVMARNAMKNKQWRRGEW
jgi:ribosome biogenesis GTPase / thiamine phosphate phosphatase